MCTKELFRLINLNSKILAFIAASILLSACGGGETDAGDSPEAVETKAIIGLFETWENATNSDGTVDAEILDRILHEDFKLHDGQTIKEDFVAWSSTLYDGDPSLGIEPETSRPIQTFGNVSVSHLNLDAGRATVSFRTALDGLNVTNFVETWQVKKHPTHGWQIIGDQLPIIFPHPNIQCKTTHFFGRPIYPYGEGTEEDYTEAYCSLNISASDSNLKNNLAYGMGEWQPELEPDTTGMPFGAVKVEVISPEDEVKQTFYLANLFYNENAYCYQRRSCFALLDPNGTEVLDSNTLRSTRFDLSIFEMGTTFRYSVYRQPLDYTYLTNPVVDEGSLVLQIEKNMLAPPLTVDDPGSFNEDIPSLVDEMFLNGGQLNVSWQSPEGLITKGARISLYVRTQLGGRIQEKHEVETPENHATFDFSDTLEAIAQKGGVKEHDSNHITLTVLFKDPISGSSKFLYTLVYFK